MEDGYKLLLLTRYGQLGSSSRLRLMAYRPWLEQAGFSVDIRTFFDDAYLRHLYLQGRANYSHILKAYQRRARALFELKRYRLLWIEKELFPFLPGAVDGILKYFSVPYVVDYDDATFHRYDLHRLAIVRRLLGRRLEPLLRGASLVTAGNAYLAAYARRGGAKKVDELPTVIDLDHYATAVASSDEEFRIGWIGSPSTVHYLNIVRKPLEWLANEIRIRLVIIGALDPPPIRVPLEVHPWSVETESSLLGSVHIGIMPLTDGPWERGKCGYKLIQYMGCGKPVIASAVGVNPEIITPDLGLLAADDGQWFNALRKLSQKPLLRKKLGHAARKKVEQHYSLQVCGPQLASQLADITRLK